MTTHFSLDIETLDTSISAVVLSIGICTFDADSIGDTEHVSLQIEEQLAAGRTVSENTFGWWVDQLIAMGISPFPEFKETPACAIHKISQFIYDHTGEDTKAEAYVWVRGPHFDWAILENLTDVFSKDQGYAFDPLPVKYSHVRDQRTFCAGETLKSSELVGKPHNALGDAMNQAFLIQQVAKKYDRPFC